jgi:large subunit ribosomal protein L4e
MKASVYSVGGKQLGEVALPKAFEEPFNPELIKRAVLSIQSKRKQPKGSNCIAGRDNTATARSKRALPHAERTINVGRARLPRLKNRRHLLFGRVASVPQAVGGPKAHPPKSEKKIAEGINKKEKRKALLSAIGASCNSKLVGERHTLAKEIKLPIVVENRFELLEKTKEVMAAFRALRVLDDVESAKKKARRRSGKGKKRGRKKKQKKSVLVVTSGNARVYRAARNIPGVEVSPVESLNVELLAPGCKAGRLVLWTEGAIKALGEKA